MGCLGELNARFGRANSLGVGQEDDPGGTRGIIPVLAEKGVKGFYVGYNDGSMNLVPLEGAPKSLQTIVHDNGAHSELFAWRWVDEASGARPCGRPTPSFCTSSASGVAGEVGTIVHDEIVPARAPWLHHVAKGQTLRVVDVEGNQAVDFLIYSAADDVEPVVEDAAE